MIIDFWDSPVQFAALYPSVQIAAQMRLCGMLDFRHIGGCEELCQSLGACLGLIHRHLHDRQGRLLLHPALA